MSTSPDLLQTLARGARRRRVTWPGVHGDRSGAGADLSFADSRLVVESSLAPQIGDSINVDGVCLTVVEAQNGHLAFDVMAETTARTKGFGDAVNLEPALAAGEPLGGHYVQGHVDGVGRVRELDGERLTVEAPPEILRYCVEKGSIAVDGVSLTIARSTTRPLRSPWSRTRSRSPPWACSSRATRSTSRSTSSPSTSRS